MSSVFGYYLKYGIIIDTNERKVNKTEEMMVNWKEQYPGVRDEHTEDMSSPKGKDV